MNKRDRNGLAYRLSWCKGASTLVPAAAGRGCRAAVAARRGGCAVGVLGALLLLELDPGDVVGHQRGLHLLRAGNLHARLLGAELHLRVGNIFPFF